MKWTMTFLAISVASFSLGWSLANKDRVAAVNDCIKQTDKAIATAEEWKSLHDRCSATRDSCLELLQKTQDR